ncbi:MAG TPA: SRPBCC family protein [Anaerolineae bacterium]|nr:SRPBCC family protein [Anaerolineae bacterium]
MAKIVKTIIIDAPVEEVFSYVEEPANVPEYWPSVIEVRDVESLPGGGFKYRWVYKMAGVRFEGGTETTEFVVNQRTVSENSGGVSGTVTWTYQSEAGKTQVTFEAEYTVHFPLLRKLAESFLVKLNEQEAETLLANVKAKLED